MRPTTTRATKDGTRRSTGAECPRNIGTSKPGPRAPKNSRPTITIRLTGCVRIATAIPTIEPKVPGALGMYPTPRAVASASASRGFLRGVSGAAVASMFCVILIVHIGVQRKDDGFPLAFRNLLFSEDRFGNHVFLAGPVTQVAIPATLAAKREVRVDRRVRLRLANGALVLHGAILFFSANSVFFVRSASKDFTQRSRRQR